MRTFNTIDAETAAAIRRAAEDDALEGDVRLIGSSESGVFLPIEYVTASGRAQCRECAKKIPRGQRCVTFRLDLYLRRFGNWGNAVEAYLHTECHTDQKGAS